MVQKYWLVLSFYLFSGSFAGTLATFRTSVGTLELEFFDQDKPITVSNFVKYVTSGRFENMFVQRWETNFVIQGGGYYVETTPEGSDIRPIQTFGQITNEYSVGATYSNTYGTIAMARQSGKTNSASSQWFINLKDNSGAPAYLDLVDGGFTVFGRVISGHNVLDLFIPPSGVNGIYQAKTAYYNSYGEPIVLNALPVRKTNASLDDLVYVDIRLRKEMNLRISRKNGKPLLTWTSTAGVVNHIEFTSTWPPQWQRAVTFVGTGAQMEHLDDTPGAEWKIYRVALEY